MTAEVKAVAAVVDGWVMFADPGSKAVLFRRSVETHEMMTGRAAEAGEVYEFKVEHGEEGERWFYYTPSALRKRVAQ